MKTAEINKQKLLQQGDPGKEKKSNQVGA